MPVRGICQRDLRGLSWGGYSEACEGPGGMDPIVVYLRGVLVRGIWRARALRDSLSVLSLFPTRAALRGKVLSG